MELVGTIGDGHFATTPLTSEEQAKDDLGFTNVNLHRRMDKSKEVRDPIELQPREYNLRICSTESFRTVRYFIWDDDDIHEIP